MQVKNAGYLWFLSIKNSYRKLLEELQIVERRTNVPVRSIINKNERSSDVYNYKNKPTTEV